MPLQERAIRGDLVADEHLAGTRQRRDARGEVHGGAEEVAVALDGGSAGDADTHGRVERRRQRALDDPQPGGGGLGGVGDPHHDGVAERLDDVGVGAQLALDAEPQPPRQLGRAGVAVILGEGGEADDVGEQEGSVPEADGSLGGAAIRDRLEHGHSLGGWATPHNWECPLGVAHASSGRAGDVWGPAADASFER